MGRAEFKVPGGKLIAAETEVSNGHLKKVKITGDFFMHPEEAIEELEKALINTQLDKIEEVITNFFINRSVEIIGVSPEDFIHVLKISLG